MSLLHIRSGADFLHEAQFRNEDDSVMNLTGFAVTAEIRWSSGVLALTNTPVNLSQGLVRLSLTEIQTASLAPGRGSTLRITHTSPGGYTDWSEIGVLVTP